MIYIALDYKQCSSEHVNQPSRIDRPCKSDQGSLPPGTVFPCFRIHFSPCPPPSLISIFLFLPKIHWWIHEILCILGEQHVRLLKCWSRRNKSFPANCAIFPTHRHCIFAPSEIYSETRKKDAESWFLLIQLEKEAVLIFASMESFSIPKLNNELEGDSEVQS